MRTEYDFTEAVRNPYVKKEKKAVTIRLEKEVVDYFKAMSAETGIPYQNLINLYLRDCAEHNRKLSLVWRNEIKGAEGGGRNG
jgi:predicted DNA binding CopG/RHH family protein